MIFFSSFLVMSCHKNNNIPSLCSIIKINCCAEAFSQLEQPFIASCATNPPRSQLKALLDFGFCALAREQLIHELHIPRIQRPLGIPRASPGAPRSFRGDEMGLKFTGWRVKLQIPKCQGKSSLLELLSGWEFRFVKRMAPGVAPRKAWRTKSSLGRNGSSQNPGYYNSTPGLPWELAVRFNS